jgi:hypothetical protein
MKRFIIFTLAALMGFLWACQPKRELKSPLKEGLYGPTLITPLNNAQIALNSLDKQGDIVVSWAAAQSGLNSKVTYKFVLDRVNGDFSLPLIEIPSDNNGTATTLTVKQQSLEGILSQLSVPADSFVTFKWNVLATNGTVTKKAEQSFLVSFKRFADAVGEFGLTSPPDGFSVNLFSGTPDAPIEITWEAPVSGMGTPLSYEWLADLPGGDFSSPKLKLKSDNNGSSNMLTLTHKALDDALGSIGIPEKTRADVIWTVKATAGKATASARKPYAISIGRFGLGVPVTFTVWAPKFTPANKDVFFAGEFGFLGTGFSNWQQPGTNANLKLTNNGNSSYSITLLLQQGAAFNFKCFLATTSAPNWGNGERKFRFREGKPESSGDGTDRRFVFDGIQTEVALYVQSWEGYDPDLVALEMTPGPSASIPNGLSPFVAGQWSFLSEFYASPSYGDWQQPGLNANLQMSLSDGKYYFIFPSKAGLSFEYKYFVSTTSSPRWNNGEQRIDAGNCVGLSGNRRFTLVGGQTVYSDNVEVWEGFCPR